MYIAIASDYKTMSTLIMSSATTGNQNANMFCKHLCLHGCFTFVSKNT